MKRRRGYSTTIFVLLAIIGLTIGLTRRWIRQTRLDHELIAALAEYRPEIVLSLFKRGANPNVLEVPQDNRPLWDVLTDNLHEKHAGYEFPSTVLTQAAYDYKIEAVRLLLTKGTKVHLKNTA